MPQFSPSESKTARAPITVKPSGLSCQAELYLVSNSTKVVTSGIKPFTSTGVKQEIAFPITMPSAEGTYPIYLDIFTNGLLIGAYKATEDVVIMGVADIRVENLTITPSEVFVGEKVTISVRAINYGTKAGSKTITCTVS